MAAENRRRRVQISPRSDINITPLIDVLLVLIVIFMVIAPTSTQAHRAEIPTGPSNENTPVNNTLVLTIDGGGALQLNSESLAANELGSRLNEVFRSRSDRTLFIQADGDLVFNEVAQLIDAARVAGAERIGLMTARIEPR